jgi:hypothetical protein
MAHPVCSESSAGCASSSLVRVSIQSGIDALLRGIVASLVKTIP